MGIRRCVIVGCTSNSLNKNMRLFAFPKRGNLLHNIWMEACEASIENIQKQKISYVCVRHFMRHNIGARRLVNYPIPSLHLDGNSDGIADEKMKKQLSNVDSNMQKMNMDKVEAETQLKVQAAEEDIAAKIEQKNPDEELQGLFDAYKKTEE